MVQPIFLRVFRINSDLVVIPSKAQGVGGIRYVDKLDIVLHEKGVADRVVELL